jgi:sigma-B regulation protein RsbQ
MKTIERDNVRIDYTIAGKGETTLLFIHGAFINKDYWNAQVQYFSHSNQVVTIDLAGHGKSGKNRNDWSIQAFGDDVVKIIRELNLSNIILIGHSLGGDVILEVANKIPNVILGFVGIDNFKNAGAAMPDEIQSQIEQVINLLKYDFSKTVEVFVEQALLTPSTESSIRKRIIKDSREFDQIIGIPLLASSFSYYSHERELLQNLKFKLYLINVDYMPTNEDLLREYAHSGYEISQIQGTCHYPMIEKPMEFNLTLQNILIKIKTNKQFQVWDNDWS